MKQTKVTPFKVASIILLLSALALKIFENIANFWYPIIKYGVDFELWQAVKSLFWLTIRCIPLLVILAGFIFFYKKGKSTVIFGIGFMLLLLGSGFTLLKTLFTETDGLFERVTWFLERLFEGRMELRGILTFIVNTTYLLADLYFIPLTFAVVYLVASVNGFIKTKFAKLTAVILLIPVVFEVVNDIVFHIRAIVSLGFGEYLEWVFLDNFLPIVFLPFICICSVAAFMLSVIVFLVYRIKSKKDVDKAPEKETSYENLPEIPIIEES